MSKKEAHSLRGGEVTFPLKIIWGSKAPTKVSFFCLGSNMGPDPNYGPAQEERMGFGRFFLCVKMQMNR